jgi:succinate-acetate transporter protein
MDSNSKDFNSLAQVAKEVKGLGHHIHPTVPNPAPLGLFAFGLTTALLQIKHTHIGGDDTDDLNGTDALVLGFALFFGGLLQIVAGLSEIKRNNIFGYTAFLLYGGFWMSMGTIEIVGLVAPEAPPVNPKALQALLILCGIFTTVLWICTFKMNKTICLLFGLLATTFYVLAAGVRNETIDQVGGYIGLLTAATAFWLASVEIINDIVGEGKEIVPLGLWSSTNHQEVSTGVIHAPGRIHAAIHGSVVNNLPEQDLSNWVDEENQLTD